MGYPILPLVTQLVAGTPDESAKYIHWGATTQDIMDDASILQMKQGLDLVGKELDTLERILSNLATKHRDTYVIPHLCHNKYKRLTTTKSVQWQAAPTSNTPSPAPSATNAPYTSPASSGTKNDSQKSKTAAYSYNSAVQQAHSPR